MDRRVSGRPAWTVFKPAGAPVRDLPEIELTLDEFEAVRLADHEGLYQEAAALRMGVSRQTFGRIVESARRKIAGALVNGCALRVEGGKTVFDGEEGTMKIAVPTKDGNVDAHFGHCAYYTLYTVQNGAIVAEENLASPAGCGCKSGIGGDLARAGVRTMIAGNIGEGAVRVLGSFGIGVVRGASGSVRQAAEDFVAGKITDTGANCAAHGESHGADHQCSHG
jgi:predicted DNA-binding protein (UPF0251 family)/predicted Fe-Mo cluster-binding NifX family protein